MARWMRLAGLVAVLAIGDSCGLKPPAVPHLDAQTAAAPRPGRPAKTHQTMALAALAGDRATQAELSTVRLPSR